MVKPLEISIPEDWKEIFQRLDKGKAIILGSPDAGKSTLSKFLVSEFCRKGIKTGLVDADIGQSILGPPTTIGLALFNEPPDWEKVEPQSVFFVGSTSPEGHFSTHIKGTRKMVERALSSGAEIVIVDTTGLVSGEAGRELKRRKIEIISPEYILALQRTDELEHILGLYKEDGRIDIQRLSVSEIARQRLKEERRIYRNRRFKEYFGDSCAKEINLMDVVIEGKVIIPREISVISDRAVRIEGLLVGLIDKRDNTLALGVIKESDIGIIRIITSIKEIDRVKVIRLGSLKLNTEFEEEPF